MVFVEKWPFFQPFFFRHYRPGKCLLRYSKTKKHISRLKNKKFKKSKNWHFSKGDNPWFLVQKWPFFQHYLFRQYRPGKCLLRYFTMEKRLSGQKKTKSPKRRKIKFFQKGLTHGFGPKMAIFKIFFFLAIIRQENVFYDILEQKKPPF